MTEYVTLKDARDAIMKRWIAMWDSRTAFVFDNEVLDPPRPVPPNTYDPELHAWCRLTVRHTTARQQTLGTTGSRKFERKGRIVIQVFVPVDTGTADADTLAQAARAIFEGARFSGVVCYAGRVRETGSDERWFQINVDVSFVYHETK